MILDWESVTTVAKLRQSLIAQAKTTFISFDIGKLLISWPVLVFCSIIDLDQKIISCLNALSLFPAKYLSGWVLFLSDQRRWKAFIIKYIQVWSRTPNFSTRRPVRYLGLQTHLLEQEGNWKPSNIEVFIHPDCPIYGVNGPITNPQTVFVPDKQCLEGLPMCKFVLYSFQYIYNRLNFTSPFQSRLRTLELKGFWTIWTRQ